MKEKRKHASTCSMNKYLQ